MTDLNIAAGKISEADESDPAAAIQKIIATELAPKVHEYEREMISIRDKMFGDLIKKIASWEVPAISAAYFRPETNATC